MKKIYGLILGVAIIGQGAWAQNYNSPDADGYLARAIAMYADKNYQGCINQLSELALLNPDVRQIEDADYYRAMSSLLRGDDEALPLLRNFLTDHPESNYRQDVEMVIGDYYFSRGSYPYAVQSYAKVEPRCLSTDRATDLTYRKAYSLMMLGDGDKARTLFESLVSNPKYALDAQFYLGYISYRERDYYNALALWRNIDQSRQPASAVPYYATQISFAAGHYEKAYKQAIELLNDGKFGDYDPELQRIAGESLFNLGRKSEAIPYLEKYVKSTDSPESSTLYMLGVNAFDSGDYTEAINYLQPATQIADAMGQSAYLYLGQCYAALSRSDAALLAFEKAYRMNYDSNVSEAAFYNYIVARTKGGRIPFSNSVEMYHNFLEQYPRSRYAAEIQESLVTGYMSGNDYRSALDAINRMEQPSPNVMKTRQRALFQLGARAYSQGDYATARDYLEKALANTPSDPEVARQCSLWLGNCYYESDQLPKAIVQYNKFITSTPPAETENLALAYYNLGYARFKEHQYQAAYSDFSKVITSDAPKAMKSDAYLRAGDCLYYQHKFDEADSYYRKAASLDPSAADYALLQQAMIKGYKRDYKGKIDLIEQLTERYPSSGWTSTAMLEMANAYEAQGNDRRAAEIYQLVAEKYPTTSAGRSGRLQLAQSYLNSDRKKLAIETYREIITLYPTSEEARLAVEDLKKIYVADGNVKELTAFLATVPGAPSLDASEVDDMAFAAAEQQYFDKHRVTQLEQYLDEYPEGANRARALYYLAECSYDQGNMKSAVAYAQEVIVRYPDAEAAENALLLMAEAEAAQGKHAAAFDTFVDLERRTGDARMLSDARIGIARCAIELERYDDALDATSRLIATTATNPETLTEARFIRGLAFDKTGKTDEAIATWSEDAANPQTLYGAKSAVYKAETQLAAGRLDQARTTVDTLIDSDTPQSYWLARGFITLSDILRAQGNKFEADEYLKSLKANYPGREKDILEMIDDRLTNN